MICTTFPELDCHLDAVGGLRAPVSLRAMLAGPLEVLVGSPMPDRSKVRGQTKSNLPALQTWGFCPVLTTLSCKKRLV